MHTTVIDTLATPQAEQQAALAGESGQSSVRYNHWHRAAETDTTPPDPRLMGPLAPGQPLTMKPEMFTTDYWAESLRYKPQNEFAAELDSLSGMSDSTLMSIKPTGIAGDPVPYQFRTDSIVTIILMLSFFLMVKVVSGSRHYLHQQIKDFFHHRQRENLLCNVHRPRCADKRSSSFRRVSCSASSSSTIHKSIKPTYSTKSHLIRYWALALPSVVYILC